MMDLHAYRLLNMQMYASVILGVLCICSCSSIENDFITVMFVCQLVTLKDCDLLTLPYHDLVYVCIVAMPYDISLIVGLHHG